MAEIPEFELLLNISPEDLAKLAGPILTQSILRVREGKVQLSGGYDGVFGKIQIYSQAEREKLSLKPKQVSLF